MDWDYEAEFAEWHRHPVFFCPVAFTDSQQLDDLNEK